MVQQVMPSGLKRHASPAAKWKQLHIVQWMSDIAQFLRQAFKAVWSETEHVATGNYYGVPSGPVATPFSALKDLVDGGTGDLVTHHPGIRVSGWNAGAVEETIGVLSAAFREHDILCLACP